MALRMIWVQKCCMRKRTEPEVQRHCRILSSLLIFVCYIVQNASVCAVEQQCERQGDFIDILRREKLSLWPETTIGNMNVGVLLEFVLFLWQCLHLPQEKVLWYLYDQHLFPSIYINKHVYILLFAQKLCGLITSFDLAIYATIFPIDIL